MPLKYRGMISKNFLKNATACRELFFSETLPQSDLERYQRLLRENASDVPVIDVISLSLLQLFCMERSKMHECNVSASSRQTKWGVKAYLGK
jgi:hypothetical protein